MLAAHCTPAYRFKGGVPALGESPAPLVRVRAHIELERKAGEKKKSRDSVYRVYRRLPPRASSRVDGVYFDRRRLQSRAPIQKTGLLIAMQHFLTQNQS